MANDPSADDETKLSASLADVLDGLGESDLELLDPPDDIWHGIEAALERDRRATPRRAPTRDAKPTLTTHYRIDAEDRVIAGGTWSTTDDPDHDPGFLAPAAGSTLWAHMAPGTTRDLWVLLVDRARASQHGFTVPFRCDSATARRWFEMTVEPTSDRGVSFRSTLVFEENREPLALLAADVERDLTLGSVALCSWCGRGQAFEEWVDLEDLTARLRLLEGDVQPELEAGVCGGCRDEMAAELHAQYDAR